MQFLLGFATLATMASSVVAVNVGVWRINRCSGTGYAQCSNLASNQCCIALSSNTDTQGATSALFFGLSNPTRVNGWQRTRDGNSCGSNLITSGTAGGNVCLNANRDFGTFSGLSYTAGQRKARRDEPILEPSRCTKTVEADTFVVDDGQEYDLTKMPRALKLQLWNLSGTPDLHTAILSGSFAAFKKNVKAANLPSGLQHVQG